MIILESFFSIKYFYALHAIWSDTKLKLDLLIEHYAEKQAVLQLERYAKKKKAKQK